MPNSHTLRRLCLAVGLATLAAGCNLERNESIKLTNEALRRFDGGDVGGALTLLKRAAAVDEKNDRAHFYMGLIQYQRAGLLDDAQANLRKAAEMNPEEGEYAYHLGAVLAKQDNWGAAINALEKAIEKRPDHAESRFRLARALEMQTRFDRAQDEYIEAIKLRPRFPEAYNALGNLYVRFERYPEAIQVFKNAIENNPDEATNYNDLGLVYQQQQRFEEAIAQFMEATKRRPTYTSALFNLGMAYATNDNPEQAVKYLKLYLARRTGSEDPTRVRTAEDVIAKIEHQAQAVQAP